MKTILETERLLLREFHTEDTEFIIELLNSPGWIKYIGDRNVKTVKDATNYLENGPLKSYREFGYGLSLVELKNGNLPIGMSGILNRQTLDTPDIGFAFLPGYEGKGYGFKIAEAIMIYARKVLNLSAISAITLPDNFNSIELLKKLKFVLVKQIFDPVTRDKLLLFTNEVE